DLLKLLKSCESDISNSCEKIMNQINLNKNVETESCRLKTYLRRGLSNFKVIENLSIANDKALEFYRCLTDHKALQSSRLVKKSNALYMLGKHGYILKDVGVMPKVIKLLKSIQQEDTCYGFGCKQSRVVFNDKNELLKFIHSYNVDNVLPKLHVDFSNNSLLYKESLSLSNTMATVIDVADKQVILYHVYNEDEHKLLNTIHKDLKERKGFTKEQISNIVINSFMNVSKCSLPLAMSVAYITLAKSNSVPKDLLSNGVQLKLTGAPRNLYEFVCTHDATNIQISHGNVYLRCNAACKARGFKTIVKYDESIESYYTIVKFRSNGWVGVDNTINVIELVREFEKSGEFDNNCDKHFLHLTNNLKEFMNNKDAKKNKDIDNIIKFYEVGKKYAHNNKLIEGLEDLKAKIKCDDIVKELKKCKAI
uniref:hypothetical protein n=1 Tax=Paraclostridium bifermentans TaxID=1490 RepID=UPI00374E813B